MTVRSRGYEVELDAWDWGAGDNFVLKMSSALDAALDAELKRPTGDPPR